MRLYALSIVFSILLAGLVRADHAESVSWYTKPILITGIVLLWLVGWGIFLIFKRKNFIENEDIKEKVILYPNKKKIVIFVLMILPIAVVTIFIAVDTIYENIYSATGGPVHWHADYQVWACGERLDLIDPKFPSNKIGTPLFHEHNDDRMHIEGTVTELNEVSLGHYFEIIGGKLSNGMLVYPTDNGLANYDGLSLCNGEPSTLKVYVNGKFIEDYENYLIYPNAYVPPGDCIIIEFGPESDTNTNKICESWSAKGWDYNNYSRPAQNIGGTVWQ